MALFQFSGNSGMEFRIRREKDKSSPVAFRHSLTIVCGKRGSRDAIDP